MAGSTTYAEAGSITHHFQPTAQRLTIRSREPALHIEDGNGVDTAAHAAVDWDEIYAEVVVAAGRQAPDEEQDER